MPVIVAPMGMLGNSISPFFFQKLCLYGSLLWYLGWASLERFEATKSVRNAVMQTMMTLTQDSTCTQKVFHISLWAPKCLADIARMIPMVIIVPLRHSTTPILSLWRISSLVFQRRQIGIEMTNAMVRNVQIITECGTLTQQIRHHVRGYRVIYYDIFPV